MTLILQNFPPIPSHNHPPIHPHTVTVCAVSNNNSTDKPKTRAPRITKIKIKEPDDYHATLKALNSKGRMPRKALGQV